MSQAERDDCLMMSPSAWGTGQEHGVHTLALYAARDDVVMPFPEDWGVCNQLDAKDPRYTVPEGTTSTSHPRQPTISSDGDDD